MPVSEVAVNWQEVEGEQTRLLCQSGCLRVCVGSKLVPFWSWLQMAKDLLLISVRYVFGIWTVSPQTKAKAD